MTRRFHKEAFIFLFFIILTLIWTYPLIFKIDKSIFSDPKWTFDSLGALRAIWWMKYVWLNKLPSNFDSLVAYPFGFSLRMKNSQPALSYSVLILSLWKDEIFARNFFILVSYIFSAVVMYYLVYHLTGSKISSIIGGLVYSFAPNHSLQSFSHLGLASTQWMPLYVLFLFKSDKERSYGSALLCGAAFSLVTLSNPYYGYFMFVFTIGFIFFRMIYNWVQGKEVRNGGRAGNYFKVILAGVSIALIIILPFTYSIVKSILSTSDSAEAESLGYVRPLKDLYKYSARVSDYFAPSEYHPILGKIDFWFMKPYTKPSRHWTERTLCLGMVPLFLTVYGVIRWWRRKKRRISSAREDFIIPFLIFSAFLAFLFSLAPTIEIFGTTIPMPSFFMYKIAPMFRVSARFGVVVILCVSVLAGFGIKELLRRVQTKTRQVAVTFFMVGFILFEFTVIPPFRNVDLSESPPVYEWLASEPSDVVIAEYPWLMSIDEEHYKYLFYQRVHQKKMVNGAPDRTLGDAIRKEATRIENPRTPSILSYLGAKYVIVHKDAYNPEDITRVSNNPGLIFVKDFPGAVVYEVVAKRPELVRIFWRDFAAWERWDDDSTWRWSGDNATMWLSNARDENIQIDFEFTVLPFHRDRTLEIFLNDEMIKSMKVAVVPEPSLAQKVSLKMRLMLGENIVRFYCPQGETVIDDILHNGDQRRVSFAFSDFRISEFQNADAD